MKLLKSAIVAFTLTLAMGSFSTTAVACEDGRQCIGNVEAINGVLDNIDAAKKAIADGADEKSILKIIKKAKDWTKEINSEKVDRKKQKYTKYFIKAKKAIRESNSAKAIGYLDTAKKGFKGFLAFVK